MTLLDSLRTTLSAQTLRWATGQQMFCPHCDKILDCRSAALLKNPKYHVVCLDCLDKIVAEKKQIIARYYDPDPHGIHGLTEAHRASVIADELSRCLERLIDITSRDVPQEELI